MSRFQNIPDSEFIEVIQTSFYMVDVLEKLGYTRTSGTMAKHIKKRAEELGIDTSHFLGQGGTRGGGTKPLYTLEEILIENSTYANRGLLKRRLLREGILENVCNNCGVSDTWYGKPIVLHLDHVNGVYNDNRITNLRLLCPNCHSQTDTYSGKNIKKLNKDNKECNNNKEKDAIKKGKVIENRNNIILTEDDNLHIPKGYKEEKCRGCGVNYLNIRNNPKFCSNKCANFYKRKTERPTKDELYQMLKDTKSFVYVGRTYGVSDNAVRKWCKSYDIPHTTRYYKHLKTNEY